MNWKTLLTPSGLVDAAIAAGLVLLGIYKKEAQDGFRAFFGWCWAGCIGWLRRLVREPVAQQLPAAALQAILGSGLEGLTTMLLLLLKEYQADRVSITEYDGCADGSALVTCVAQVREAEMKSVQELQATPLARPLWLEIQRVPFLPGRVLFVEDARTSESAALRDALPASGAWSAYYQAMPDPTGEYKHITLLAISWQHPHQLTPAQLHALHQSGVACATVLSLYKKAEALKASLSAPGK